MSLWYVPSPPWSNLSPWRSCLEGVGNNHQTATQEASTPWCSFHASIPQEHWTIVELYHGAIYSVIPYPNGFTNLRNRSTTLRLPYSCPWEIQLEHFRSKPSNYFGLFSFLGPDNPVCLDVWEYQQQTANGSVTTNPQNWGIRGFVEGVPAGSTEMSSFCHSMTDPRKVCPGYRTIQ